MKVHHLNCGTMCPLARRLMTGEGSVFERGRFVCHVLLIETDAGLVLVDTGFGRHDCANPKEFGWLFNTSGKPYWDVRETAHHQVQALGLDPNDVRHIVVTHLDLDHAGGFADFPNAKIHVHQRELDAATGKPTRNSKLRYLPRHWAHGADFEAYSDDGEDWFGFRSVEPLRGVSDQIVMIPLFGHSRGHSAVAVKAADRWLMHCGDGFFHRNQVDPSRPNVPFGIRFFQNTMVVDRAMRDTNVERLRTLVADHRDSVEVFCAHDVATWRQLSGQELGPRP